MTFRNENLNVSKRRKNDEYYTTYRTVRDELRHYGDEFAGKVVYCNCDHPHKSNFVKYFIDNFHRLGLKKLIATNYVPLDMFSEDGDRGMLLEYEGVFWRSVSPLEGDGDFRSMECIEYLKECDIVVTNPPFSLFREFVEMMMRYDKKFLVIGHLHAVTYLDVLSHIKDGRIWMGVEMRHRSTPYVVPGESYASYVSTRWWTNIGRMSYVFCELHDCFRYTPQQYPTYENYDAIECNRVSKIPIDYDGVIGVPITFIDKYHPSQFKIVGVIKPYCRGEWLYQRLLIRRV